MSNQLTTGAIQSLLNGSTPQEVGQPILQVLNVKKITTSSQQDRYRVTLWDGMKVIPAMIASALNELITSDQLDRFAIIRPDVYLNNEINEKRILIIMKLAILQVGRTVGGQIQAQNGGAGHSAGAQAGKPSTVPSRPSGGSVGSSSAAHGVGGVRSGSYESHAPVMQRGTQGEHRVFPIISLTPYQNRWTIRARVTQKSRIKSWSNARGEGRLFSVDLLDETCEIRATAFGNDAISKFYDLLEVDNVYFISRGTLKPARKEFSSIKNEYELHFNNDTIVEPCFDSSDLPHQKYNFVPIDKLMDLPKDSVIDVIGIVKDAGELASITVRNQGRQVNKRDITLMDSSGKGVQVTFWDKEAEEFDGTNHPILAVKGAKTSDFGGCSLKLTGGSACNINPDIAEAHQLRGWFDSIGKDTGAESITTARSGGGGPAAYKCLSQVKDENLGFGQTADYFNALATVVYVKSENCLYQACPAEGCKKKVIDEGSGYRCEKCDQVYPNFVHRLLLNLIVADFSGNQWITCFQDTGEVILSTKAQDLGELKENEGAFDEVFAQAHWKHYDIKLRAKADTYNDETRVKCVCVDAKPVDYRQASQHLLQEIRALQG